VRFLKGGIFWMTMAGRAGAALELEASPALAEPAGGERDVVVLVVVAVAEDTAAPSGGPRRSVGSTFPAPAPLLLAAEGVKSGIR